LIKFDIVTSLLLSSDENFLLTGCANGKIIIWDLDNPGNKKEREIGKKEINMSNSSIVTLALTADDQIIFGTTDGKIGITRDSVNKLNENEVTEIDRPINTDGQVFEIILTPEGRNAICVNRQGMITKWETSTGRLVWKIEREQYHKYKVWDPVLFKTFISTDYSVAVIEFADLDYGGGLGLIGIDLQTAENRLIIDPADSPDRQETAKRIEHEIDSILKINYGDIFDKNQNIAGEELQQSKIMTQIASDDKRMLKIVDNKENLITRFIFEEPLEKTVIFSNGSIVACASIYGDLYFLELRFPET
ncbi:unnamed protein product, partial [marine sediment metagenome]